MTILISPRVCSILIVGVPKCVNKELTITFSPSIHRSQGSRFPLSRQTEWKHDACSIIQTITWSRSSSCAGSLSFFLFELLWTIEVLPLSSLLFNGTCACALSCMHSLYALVVPLPHDSVMWTHKHNMYYEHTHTHTHTHTHNPFNFRKWDFRAPILVLLGSYNHAYTWLPCVNGHRNTGCYNLKWMARLICSNKKTRPVVTHTQAQA
jgi:hypothetical protein